MKITHLFYTGLLASAVIVSCQKDEKKQEQTHQKEEKAGHHKRQPLDFSSVKAELKLEAEKEKSFDEIITKYQKQMQLQSKGRFPMVGQR